jgi:glycosyltransferase involved in cell wall biosynthesis
MPKSLKKHLLSVNWSSHHRRSAELANALKVEANFIRGDSSFLPIRYFQQWRMTRRLLNSNSPDVILVMQPPPFALACAYIYARRHGKRLIGDLHTGVFMDPRWKWSTRFVLGMLRKRGLAVVPNEQLALLCRTAGVPAIVSHGYLTEFDRTPRRTLPNAVPEGTKFVLVPLAFAYDEPILEILEAARTTPEMTWVLTGRAPKAIYSSAPSNVVLTGYVSIDDYHALRAHAAVVLASTTAEDTMQSAGYEALAAGTPLVTTPTAVLVDYFRDAALYADPAAAPIAREVARAARESSVWSERMAQLRNERIMEQDAAIDSIVDWVDNH